MKVALIKVVHTGLCNRVSWIGLQVRITLADGTDVLCEHGHGHRKRRCAIACAARLVARLNRAAGTSTDAVEAAKARRKVPAGAAPDADGRPAPRPPHTIQA